MSAFYNEHDPKAAAWLRELIRQNLIAPGIVDERSITDVHPNDLRGFTQVHLFAGIGGWSLALRLAEWPDERPVWSCSCPCQPFSAAGLQRGTDDERHLWPEALRLIRACRPAFIIGEQVASAAVIGSTSGKAQLQAGEPPVWIDGVFADFEDSHYACAAADIPAAGIGAPHIRQRLYWMAYSNGIGRCAGSMSSDGHETGDALAQHGGSVSRLAHSRHESARRAAGPSETEIRRTFGYASGCREFSGLADSNGERCSRRQEPHGEQIESEQSAPRRHDALRCGSDGGMADATSSRPLSSPLRGVHRGEEGAGARNGEPERCGGAWDSFDLLSCTDGKARRVESGTFPLVDGISSRLVRGGDPSAPIDAKATAEARQARLKGYGNAIVPQLAAQFILAAQEAIGGLE